MKTRLKDLLAQASRPILSRVNRFRDIHRGESCYLLGDGVSVKWFDLRAFSDKVSLCCGLMPFHVDFDRLNTRYLTLSEPYWFYPRRPRTRSVSRSIRLAYREVMRRNPDKQFFINLSNYPVVRLPNVSFVFRDIPDDRLPPDFISRRINVFHGSIRNSIFMAIYLGFEKAYMVGYDYTHLPARSSHWYEKGEGIYYPHPGYQEDFFEIAKEFIDLTTITLDGTSLFLDSKTYQEFTGKTPVFRENTEIVPPHYLQALSTWPGYNIF